MKEITQKELNKNFVLIRGDTHGAYRYCLYKLTGKEEYFTVCRHHGVISIQPLGEINSKIPLNQNHLDFITDHAMIHVNPGNIPRWRD